MGDGSLFYVHGAGGYVEDGALAQGLAAARGLTLVMPRFSDEDMSFDAWAQPMREHLGRLGPDDAVVGHSFGASILLRVLAEGEWSVRRAALLAMPDWGPGGWDVADYAYDGPEPTVALSLHHARDDDVVPFLHLWTWRERLSGARVHEYPRGGHQFEGLAEAVARRL